MTKYFNTRTLNIKIVCACLLLSGISLISKAQELIKMTPEVYAQWNKIKDVKMSDSAAIITYILEKETGDKRLLIYTKMDSTTLEFDRVNKYSTDNEGNYVVFTKGLNYDSLRTLKRKKTKKENLPTDSLVIYHTILKTTSVIDNVLDFKLSEKYSGYCIYTRKMETVKLDTSVTSEKKKKGCDDTAMIIRHLESEKEDTIVHTKDYFLSEEFPVLAYTQCSGDSILTQSVYVRYLENDSTVLLTSNLHEVSQLSMDKQGKNVAFLGLQKKSEEAQKPFALYLKRQADISAVDMTTWFDSIVPKNWLVSNDKKISWSESGNRMFFGVAPKLLVKDTTRLEDEIVNVEIWHHDSPRLYTQMVANDEKDRKKTYDVLVDTDDMTALQIETLEMDQSILSSKGDGRYILQINTRPYQKAVTWTGELLKDFSLLDTEEKKSVLISIGESGDPKFSPTGRYIYWWNSRDSIWKTFDTQNNVLGILGLWSVSKFHDEENDVPQNAGPYGIAGWTNGDQAAIVYDRYDLWKLMPGDPFNNTILTNGRSNKKVYRWINLDEENAIIDTTKFILLNCFDESTKKHELHRLDWQNDSINTLLKGDFAISGNIKKAKKGNDILYTVENFETFPDLLLSDTTFVSSLKISDANPQQKEYAWGKTSLFKWTNFNGKPNEGMVFYPPNFDPEIKYPLIVNFYERSSDGLYKHRAPEAHRSTINYTYYTNKGYIIFNPDIAYQTGQPGDDCYNAVESGVDALVRLGYIDESRIGLQGHSWGGYQVAYLLTKSERYKCAESGAPVVNMVSAYGGIRWESGLSRMFQYEKTQSRLGATLWEDSKVFHKNSPIYGMNNVTTPVLILHNDKDGAVPWYQGIEYYMALRRLDKPCWLLNYNNEPHWPVKWQNRLDFNIRMEQFFDHYLMDKPMPLWMKEGNTPQEKGILDKY